MQNPQPGVSHLSQSIGDKVARLRAARGWTLAEVAEQTGISISHLSAIENGTRKNPSFRVVTKIARVFNVSLDDFSTESPKKSVTKNPLALMAVTLNDHKLSAFLASEEAPRYIAFAKRLADGEHQEDPSRLLAMIAAFLSDEKTHYGKG